MASFTLLAVETAHIQSYLFNSNRLKENIGASYLVAQATGQWAYQCVNDLNIGHNLTQKAEQWVIDDSLDHINQNPALDVEVIYSGGGNFVALFRDNEKTKAFTRNLSRKVLKDARGLSLTFVQDDFVWEDEALSVKVSELLQKLPEARSEQPLRRGVAGLGVTVMCNSSSLPATQLEQDPDKKWRAYSSEVKAKQDAVMSTKDDNNGKIVGANDYLRTLLDLDHLQYRALNISGDQFVLSTELDQLGRTKGQDSYMAVVHADGNGLGLLIKGLKYVFPTSKDNPDYIDYMRGFSEKIKIVNQQAQKAMLQQIADSVQLDNDEMVIYGINLDNKINKSQKITLHKEKKEKDLKPNERNRWVLPIRPLISGGDDVTFVCDGRIALDLAVTFLKEFEDATEKILEKELIQLRNSVGKIWKRMTKAMTPEDAPDDQLQRLKNILEKGLAENKMSKLTACAGIAIVKSHYPFARAYALADDLAGEAKQLVNADAYSLNQHQHLTDLRNAVGDNETLTEYFQCYGLYQVFNNILGNIRYSAIDWHYTTGGIYDGLDEMRKREYSVAEGSLTMKPLFLDKGAHAFQNWNSVQGVTEEFQADWSKNRSKAKALMTALRKGQVEVEVFSLRYLDTDLSLPRVSGFGGDFAWDAGVCAYYDALELMDLYIPLAEGTQS